MQLRNIFDGTLLLKPDNGNLTLPFKHGQFLIFDAGLPLGEEYIIGVAYNMIIPLIGTTAPKSWETNEYLKTDEIVRIPREFSESDYEVYVAISPSEEIPNFRCYVITSEVTQETLSDDISQIQADLDLVLENQTTAFNLQAAIGVNELAQNTALSILGTGLAPISAGVTAGVIPVLTGSQLFFLLP
jgi:hypothetical protein